MFLFRILFIILFHPSDGSLEIIYDINNDKVFYVGISYQIPHNGSTKSIQYNMPFDGSSNYETIVYKETQKVNKVIAMIVYLYIMKLQSRAIIKSASIPV